MNQFRLSSGRPFFLTVRRSRFLLLSLSIGWLSIPVASAFAAVSVPDPMTVTKTPRVDTIPSPEELPLAWLRVDSLISAGFPGLALDATAGLLAAARHHRLPDHLVKGLVYRSKLRMETSEYSLPAAITDLESEAALAEGPVRQLLLSMVAECYLDYLQANQWKLAGRSGPPEPDSPDIETWTASQLAGKVRGLLRESVLSDTIRTTPLSEFRLLLTAGEKETASLRPTLFDLLMDRALSMLRENRFLLQASGASPGFLSNDSLLFAHAADFIAREVPVGPGSATDIHALVLAFYRDWLAFHRQDTAIWVDIDLQRLSFATEISASGQQELSMLAALQALSDRIGRHPAAADVGIRLGDQFARLAEQYVPLPPELDTLASDPTKWYLRKARDIFGNLVKTWPDSRSAETARQRIRSLESPAFSLQLPEATAPDHPFLSGIRYRNLQGLDLRLVRLDHRRRQQWESALRDPDSLAQVQKALERLPTVRQWPVLLPDDGDLHDHQSEFAISGLPLGYYVLVANARAAANQAASAPVVLASFQVTRLAAFYRTDRSAPSSVLVVDRSSGQPQAGVTVTRWQRARREWPRRPSPKLEKLDASLTDRNGAVIWDDQDETYRSFEISLTHGRDTFFNQDQYYSYFRQTGGADTRRTTQFFLDRAIYRPGQVVHFKILCLEYDGDNLPSIVAEEAVSVSLRDPNGQEIRTLALRTNSFGSAYGTFVLPASIRTGTGFLLSNLGNQQVPLQVEEYKRPLFEVSLRPESVARVLGDTVRVHLQAVALSGAEITDAAVQWSVERTTRFPFVADWLRSFCYSRYQVFSTTIATGTGLTGPDGTFLLSFPAVPDPRFHASDQPVYHYLVTAVVTDLTGESRQVEAQVSVGYRAMDLRLAINGHAPEQGVWPAEQGWRLDVSATNLQGDPVAATGSIRLERLVTPGRPHLSRPWPVPDRRTMDKDAFLADFPDFPWAFEDQPDQWPVRELAFAADFDAAPDRPATFFENPKLREGWYKATLSSIDPNGVPIEKVQFFQVFLPSGKPVPTRSLLSHELIPGVPGPHSYLPGESAALRLATAGKSTVPVWLEIERPGRPVERKWIRVKGVWTEFIPVTEADRGNIHVRLSWAGKGQAWTTVRRLTVPWDNKKLEVHFQSFRDKVLPGSDEEWILTVQGPSGAPVAAELAATMYDAALDAFAPNRWHLSPWPSYGSHTAWQLIGFGSEVRSGLYGAGYPGDRGYWFDIPPTKRYVRLNWFDWQRGWMQAYRMELDAVPMVAMERQEKVAGKRATPAEDDIGLAAATDSVALPAGPPIPSEPLPPVPFVRSDFGETAFFFPRLTTDTSGHVVIRFRNKDALTRWKILLLAHTQGLETALLEKSLQTRQPFMVVSAPPRFFREFDRVVFTAKVVNLSDTALVGRVRLDLADGLTGAAVDFEGLSADSREKDFALMPGASAGVRWEWTVPSVSQVALLEHTVRAVAESYSDAERGITPVLTNLELVTETLPLPVRESEIREFRLESLAESVSPTLRHEGLTVEFTSHPVWLAVQALPFPILRTDDCNESLFTRYFAHATASRLLRDFPMVRRVLQTWRDFPAAAPAAKLTEHPDLKSALLTETPWVWEARREEDQLRDLAILLDQQTVDQQTEVLLQTLLERQSPSGGWPWFPGGPDSWSVTTSMLEGFGQLLWRGALDGQAREPLRRMVAKAVAYGDAALLDRYESLMSAVRQGKARLEDDHLDAWVIQYLYARVFFLPGQGREGDNRSDAVPVVPLDHKMAGVWEYYLGQAGRYWLGKGIYSEGQAAWTLYRAGQPDVARRIVGSLKDRAIRHPELGMYWKVPAGWSWYRSSVELQALMMVLFEEVTQDERSVQEMMVWLLKQKQTHRWQNGKATVNAIHAILSAAQDSALQGETVAPVLGGDHPSETTVRHNEALRKRTTGLSTAGTGYYSYRIPGPDIRPDMGDVRVENPNPTVAWGAVYWQYFESSERIRAFDDTPLRLEKSLFRAVPSDSGEVLVALSTGDSLTVGEKVLVRLVVRSDRDMSFVHLKDMRAATFEPLATRSGYQWKGGLGWYESIRDTATDFYFDRLPQGTHVLTYPLRVTHRGTFSNGIARIQSMYTPEFSGHSEGREVIVK